MNKKHIVLIFGLASAALACSHAGRPTRDSLVAAFDEGFIKSYVELFGRNEFGELKKEAEIKTLDDGDTLAVLEFSDEAGAGRQDIRFRILEADAYPAVEESAGLEILGVGRILYRITKVTRMPDGKVSPETVYEEEKFAVLAKKDKIWNFRDDDWIRRVHEGAKASASAGNE